MNITSTATFCANHVSVVRPQCDALPRFQRIALQPLHPLTQGGEVADGGRCEMIHTRQLDEVFMSLVGTEQGLEHSNEAAR